MQKVIYFDVDGVLLDYITPFLRYAGIPSKPSDIKDYDLTKLFHSKERCFQVMQEFSESEEFQRLQPLINPVNLNALKAYGYSIRIVSQVHGSIVARVSRVFNLASVFGAVFDKIIFTDRGESKLDAIKEDLQSYLDLDNYLGIGSVYIVEDNPHFFDELLSNRSAMNLKKELYGGDIWIGLTGIKILQSYNEKAASRTFISTDEFAKQILYEEIDGN